MRISDWSSDVCSSDLFGIVGMVIAIATTLAAPGVLSYTAIVVGVLIGGAIGTVVALRIQMTALPPLVIWIRNRSEEHTSELQYLMRISYAVFGVQKKKTRHSQTNSTTTLI